MQAGHLRTRLASCPSLGIRFDLGAVERPAPGTVLFLGYGSRADGDPDPMQRFNWQPLRRASDYFFAKYSYLLRL